MSIRVSLRALTGAVTCFGLLALGTACRDATGYEARQSEAAGLYRLASVSGRGPEAGTFLLTADGMATRRVKYPASVSTLEYVMSGTYRLDGAGGIAFALSESMISSYMWPVRGEWRGSSFSITYPDPADGPDIVETYQRLP
jgi:hypothetical protein